VRWSQVAILLSVVFGEESQKNPLFFDWVEAMSERIVYPAPDLALCEKPETPWERERRAFWKLLPELLESHNDQYVAIHGGQVVASGTDTVAVAMEAYSRVGYVPLYLGQVTTSPRRAVRVPSPRIWRDQGRP
jgi:hypothetical protein